VWVFHHQIVGLRKKDSALKNRASKKDTIRRGGIGSCREEKKSYKGKSR